MTMRLKAMPALLSLLALGACTEASHAPVRMAPASELASITLSVGPCFGFCPVYDLTLQSNGDVLFDGKRHTAIVGERRRNIPQATYRAIAADLARFRPAGSEPVPAACDAAISDTSSFTVTWRDAGGGQAITTTQRGCPGGPGHELNAILETVPERLGVADWAKQTTRAGEGRG